ncbi:uncharacterized protein LOC110643396 [Hevea brasiliensis]|nr:uncharacterized protein LOC110643396 [Hevea brasiliensis]
METQELFRMQDLDSTVSFSPSFNSYSSDQLADIADKVGKEEANNMVTVFTNQNDNHSSGSSSSDEDDVDFEFVLVGANPEFCTATDEDHKVAFPIFPLFDRDLLLKYENESKDQSQDHKSSTVRLPLENMFIEDRDPPSSSSGTDADELDGILPETYCVWTPQKSSQSPSPNRSPSRCKKSNSTGSSSKQRWRLLDLLHLRRCSSDGKESFIFLNPDHNHHHDNNNNINSGKKEEKVEKGKIVTAKAGMPKGKVSAHELFYIRNKALKEGDKRKSYLPYRQGLVGFFANVNGPGRNFPPF